MVQGVFVGFVASSRDFLGLCLLVPFDHPCPLKSGVSALGKNSSLWGGTYLYGLYKGVTPRGKSPPTYQLFKRNTLTYINRKLVSILQWQLPTDPWNCHGNKGSRWFCKHSTNQQKLFSTRSSTRVTLQV